jgi:hypothetical protein
MPEVEMGNEIDERVKKLAKDLFLAFEYSETSGTFFTAHVFRLIAKADMENKRRLAYIFPMEVLAYQEWYEAPTAQEFYERYDVPGQLKEPEKPKSDMDDKTAGCIATLRNLARNLEIDPKLSVVEYSSKVAFTRIDNEDGSAEFKKGGEVRYQIVVREASKEPAAEN